jgi:fructan beta-fructosidase
VGIACGANKIPYNAAAKTLFGAPLAPVAGKIKLHALVDVGSVEVAGNDGEIYYTGAFSNRDESKSVSVYALGGSAQLLSFRVHELKSAWDDAPAPWASR